MRHESFVLCSDKSNKSSSNKKLSVLMSLPALRQPKFLSRPSETPKKVILPDVQYVIITLKDEQKLVVSSDAYHGVITVGNMYQCIFCHVEMELDSNGKEKHKNSPNHLKVLEKYPHVAEYSPNLIREVTKDSSFCTICSVIISNVHLIRHLQTGVHTQELEKAVIRASTYKPF